MKKLFLFFFAALLCIGLSAVVQNTQHDLSSGSTATFGDANVQSNNVDRICVFCHTPHQPSGTTTDPLWNHTLSSVANYGVYDSPTLDADTLVTGAIADVAASGTTSDLCMSCHDGTVGVGSLYNNPGSTVPSNSAVTVSGNALVGTDLTNDHPVNFTYANELFLADGELNDPSGAAIQALLIGGTVQCSSCHDPHDNSNGSFLVMSNAASALCLTCHNK